MAESAAVATCSSTEMLVQVTTVLGVGPLECLPLPWLHHADTTEYCRVTAPSQQL